MTKLFQLNNVNEIRQVKPDAGMNVGVK